MGAHHALVAPMSTARLGRLAGRGALTASAALALAGAGSGAALAHEGGGPAVLSGNHGSFADDGLLCGLLGGSDCSSSSSSGDPDSDESRAGSDDDTASIFDRFADRSGGEYGTDRSSGVDRSGGSATDRVGSSSSSSGSRQAEGASSAKPAQSLDTPPPPGQVRTIPIGG